MMGHLNKCTTQQFGYVHFLMQFLAVFVRRVHYTAEIAESLGCDPKNQGTQTEDRSIYSSQEIIYYKKNL